MNEYKKKVLCLVTIALIAVMVSPVLVWAAGGPLYVDGANPVNDTVVVRVANLSGTTQSGVLSVTAVVDGAPVTAAESVTVSGNSALYTTVEFGSAVDMVLVAKMTDNSDPF